MPNLIYLRAKLSGISFIVAEKVLFLRLPRNLRELSLSTWSTDYGNGDSWELLLTSKFPKLKHFRLIISLDQIPHNFETNTTAALDNIVKSFNGSKYFVDRNWNVVINVNEYDRLKFVIHSTPYPIENFQTTLYDIRRCTMSPSVIKKTYHDVTIVNLTLQNDLPSSSLTQTEHRYFPNVEQLSFLSNIQNDRLEFDSIKYFNNLKNMINLSNITSLSFTEEIQQYPTSLVNLLLRNITKLNSLSMSYQLFTSVQMQSICSLKSLKLIFAIYSSTCPPATRMRHILTSSQILTNKLILELAQEIPVNHPDIQTLAFIVRHLEGFDTQFSDWLKSHFSFEQSILYDLLLRENIVRFYF